MHVPGDDEIRQFFAGLTPEDFSGVPSGEALSESQELYPRSGPEEFERFTLDCLTILSERPTESFAALHNGLALRRYTPGEREDLPRFLNRVRREAKDFAALWFFIAAPGEAAVGDVFNPRDPAAVIRARIQGRMVQTTNWYSESREAGSAEVQFGVVLGQGEAMQLVRSTYTEGANPAFTRVMRF